MRELILKARRAIRFLFYKDLSIDNQIKISEILNDDEFKVFEDNEDMKGFIEKILNNNID